MGRTKGLLNPVKTGIAKRAHNCQANSSHRINQGDLRLEIQNGREWEKYCAACGEKILQKLQSDVESITSDFNDKNGIQNL